MRILLDTHIYLWWLQDNPNLSTLARKLILNATEVYISTASLWEAGIKINIGKLQAEMSELINQISQNGFLELQVSSKHIMQLMQLPDLHRDPFDRVLIAQALCEPLRLLSADSQMRRYSELVELV